MSAVPSASSGGRAGVLFPTSGGPAVYGDLLYEWHMGSGTCTFLIKARILASRTCGPEMGLRGLEARIGHDKVHVLDSGFWSLGPALSKN